MVSGEGGLCDDVDIFFARCCYRGERRAEFEEEYFRTYHHLDERGPRLRRLRDSKTININELYTDQAKRSSIAYNEMLARSDTANCLAIPAKLSLVWLYSHIPVDGNSHASTSAQQRDARVVARRISAKVWLTSVNATPRRVTISIFVLRR